MEASSYEETLKKLGPLQPAVIEKKKKRGRKAMQTAVLTSSEMRDALKEKVRKRGINKAKRDTALLKKALKTAATASTSGESSAHAEAKKAPAKNNHRKNENRKKELEKSQALPKKTLTFASFAWRTCRQI